MKGDETIIAMRQAGKAPAWVWVSETGDDWGKFNDAMPTVIIEPSERVEQLDLRWAVSLNLSISAVGENRMKALKAAFLKNNPKRMICTTFENIEGFMPFGVTEITDTDEVMTWHR
jgi:hypothetical protein